MSERAFYVYILASKTRVLYVGVTNNLERRLSEHKLKIHPGFTARFNVDQLVHSEVFNDPREAIACEKQWKSWGRSRKVALVEAKNPDWRDLSADW